MSASTGSTAAASRSASAAQTNLWAIWMGATKK